MHRFSLETVLTHRKHIEDVLQKEFVMAKKKLLMEEEKLATLEEIILQTLAALQEKQKTGATISDVLLYESYLKRISIDRGQHIRRITEMKSQLRQKLGELIEALKARKILDRLKEKEFEKYRKELERKERIFMGEIAISGFNMRNQPQ